MVRVLGRVAAAAVWVSCVASCLGQDGLLGELYGRGVHAYFSRDYRQAYELLTEAIRNQTNDPRVYYFRGLALRRLGRPDEAREDFQKGAELELTGGDAYPVARALERVQGAERAVLEEQRRLVRVQQFKVQSAQARARYEQTKRAEAEAVRNPARPVPAPPPVPKEADASDPFREGTNGTKVPPAPLPPAAAGASPVPVPAASSAPPNSPPKASEPAPSAAPPKPAPEADPFATPPAAPKPAPAKAPSDDPFN